MEDFYNKTTYTQNDIDQLLRDEIEESLKLEYKEAAALDKTDGKKKDISKDVASFANSDGGLIIYGIKEKNHKPVELSFINGIDFTKEWLEQIIQSTIHKKIEGLQIIPIRYNNDIKKTLYIIKIPTDSVPHMSIDNRYYRRYNFNSVPMEEYEVRNQYFKFEKTKLKLAEPIVKLDIGATNRGRLEKINLSMIFNIDNIGSTIEKLYKLEVALPRLVYILGRTSFDDFLLKHFSREENDYSYLSFPNRSPLFQNERSALKIPHLVINSQNFNALKNHKILIRLFYSGGREEIEFDINPYLVYQGNPLSFDTYF
jgi:hypothetical protein